MKQKPQVPDFFNPWNEPVRCSIAEADAARRQELAKPETKPATPPEPKPEPAPKIPKAPKPPAPPKLPREPRPEGHKPPSTASKNPNARGLACPVCGGVPETIRSDGVSMARHLPMKPGVKLYRDTPYCDGQGREGLEREN